MANPNIVKRSASKTLSPIVTEDEMEILKYMNDATIMAKLTAIMNLEIRKRLISPLPS